MPIYCFQTELTSSSPELFSEFYNNPPGEINEYAYCYLDPAADDVLVGDTGIEFDTVNNGLPIIKGTWHPIDFLNNQEDFYLIAETISPPTTVQWLVKTKSIG